MELLTNKYLLSDLDIINKEIDELYDILKQYLMNKKSIDTS